jgi:hypothetical protein
MTCVKDSTTDCDECPEQAVCRADESSLEKSGYGLLDSRIAKGRLSNSPVSFAMGEDEKSPMPPMPPNPMPPGRNIAGKGQLRGKGPPPPGPFDADRTVNISPETGVHLRNCCLHH